MGTGDKACHKLQAREQPSKKGKSQKLPAGKKPAGEDESQSFPTKIGLTSDIIEYSFSRSPEIEKEITKYQPQMKVIKQLTVFQNLCDICMPCFFLQAKHLPKQPN